MGREDEEARMPVVQVWSGRRGIVATAAAATAACAVAGNVVLVEGPAGRSVWLWVEMGGEMAPVVTVRVLSCVDNRLDCGELGSS